ncbi:hypothetical protein ACGCUR_01300 [Eubacteriales bacterium KG126]
MAGAISKHKEGDPVYSNSCDTFYEVSKDKPIIFHHIIDKEKFNIKFGEGSPRVNLQIKNSSTIQAYLTG